MLSEPLAQISEEFVELYGLLPGQSESSPEAWGCMVHADDVDRVVPEVAAASKGQTSLSIEFRICCPDGETRRIAMSLQRFIGPDGCAHVISAHQDISVITATGEALEMRRQELDQKAVKRTGDRDEAEARFRGISMRVQFISLLSPDGTTLEMSRTALDAVLLSRESISEPMRGTRRLTAAR